jgi:salicylate hydroxylase
VSDCPNTQGYPIEAGDLFNISTSQPDVHFGEQDSWTALGDKKTMLETFQDFPERVKKLLNLVPDHEVLEWRLRAHKPLPVWVDNNVALVGDACHPTLPHIAQGAAQAIEDAVALAIVLSRIKARDQVHAALMVYQTIRKPRTDWAVSMAAQNSIALHQDKATREASLALARLALADEGGSDDPEVSVDKLGTKELRDKLFKHDVSLQTEQRFDQLFAQELMKKALV